MPGKYSLNLYATEEGRPIYEKLFTNAQVLPTPEGMKDSLVITHNPDNAGFDLYCAKNQPVVGENVTLLDLGVKAVMKEEQTGENQHYWLAPRSSIWKSGVTMANSMGIIDRSYRGVLMGAVVLMKYPPVTIEAGTRLFQILPPDMGTITSVYLHDMALIDTTSRGEGGFGSTGK
jgi:dUTP pyrophosphatase